MWMPIRSRTLWSGTTLAMVAWLAVVVAGFRAIEDYETSPGASGTVPLDWPEASPLGFVPNRPNLVMAVHPRCPCSRAGLKMLRSVARDASSPASIRLLIYRPKGGGPGWADASALIVGEAIDQTTAIEDPGGREAVRFGLSTSGSVAAYDAAGRLRFSGGLTASRGREVASGGAEAVASVLAGLAPATSTSPTFGCGMAVAACPPDFGRPGS